MAPPSFVFHKEHPKRFISLQRQSVLSVTLSQIGLQEIVNEELEIYIVGSDSRSC